jgi:hypothetical protein
MAIRIKGAAYKARDMKGAEAGGESPQRLGMGTRLRNDVLKTTTFFEAKRFYRIALLDNLHLFPPAILPVQWLTHPAPPLDLHPPLPRRDVAD